MMIGFLLKTALFFQAASKLLHVVTKRYILEKHCLPNRVNYRQFRQNFLKKRRQKTLDIQTIVLYKRLKPVV